MSSAGIDAILARAIDLTGMGTVGMRRVLRVMTRLPRLAGPGRPARDPARRRGAATFRAPADMSGPAQIRAMVSWARMSVERGHSRLVIDFASLTQMDSSLLAGIVLIARLGVTHQVEVRIVNLPERLESLLDVYRVEDPLRKAGVIFDSCALPPLPARADDSPADPDATSLMSD